MCCSRCGKSCVSCVQKNEYGCEGCMNIKDGWWGSKCEIKECCEGKKLEHCGLCGDFPCELLREFSYDKETGDDGEGLLNCKKWADYAKNKREKTLRNLLIGIICGIIAGVLIGEWLGAVLPYILIGVISGGGIAVLFEINKRK